MKLVMICLMVLVVALGCGKDQPAQQPAQQAQQPGQEAQPPQDQAAKVPEPVELSIWQTYNDEENDIFLELVQNYMKQNPNVKIKVQHIPYGGHRNKILTALATRTTPDIARIDNAWIPKLAPRNAILTLDEFGAKEYGAQIIPAAFQTCLYDGKVYGLPDQLTCLALFYNKDLFTQAGLDPNAAPETWEQFIEYAKKLTVPEKNQFGFAMGNTLWETLPFFFTFGAKIMSEDNRTCLLDSPEAIQALQFKVDLYRKHKVEAGAWTAGAVGSVTGFKAQTYAMTLTGSWNLQNFIASGMNFGIGMIPKGPAGSATNVGGTNMVVFKASKNPAAAYQFLTYLTGPEAQARWMTELGQIPVNTQVVAQAEANEQTDAHLKVFLQQIKTAYPIVGNPIMDEIEAIINPEMEAALKGSKEVAQALTDGVTQVNKKLTEAFASLNQ